MRQRPILLLVLAAAVVPYFVGLGDSSIWDANEAFYTETPRQMIETGDFVTPRFNGQPRLNKPVLSYWIVGAFYQVFGVSVGVERLAIAMGAVGLIAGTFVLAGAVYGREAALWAAIALATSPRFLMFARRIFIDIYITLFAGLTLLFFALAERFPERRRLLLVLMYVAMGLGTLTKGPVAIVLPGLAFFLYLALHRQLGRIRELMVPAGILIVAVIVVPWYAALYVRYGWEPITAFFIGENVARYTDTYGFQSRGPLFYPPVVFGDMAPWSAFLIAAGILALRRDLQAPARRLEHLLWIWILAIVGFFSLSQSKQDLYILPIVPAVAAIAASVLSRSDQRGARGVARWTTVAVGTLLAAVGAIVAYLFVAPARVYALGGAAAIAWLAVAGGVVVAVLAAARRSFAAAVALAVTVIAVNWVFVLVSLPSFERYKPVPAIAGILRQRAGPDAAIAEYEVGLPSLTYYLRRSYQPIYDREELVRLFASGRDVYAIMTERHYEERRHELGTTCVIDRRPLFDVKLGNVLARSALPELLVVTNQCP
jgi:4-amino-4-deoxy-L-arabinose transferase-like glycosyltransferase